MNENVVLQPKAVTSDADITMNDFRHVFLRRSPLTLKGKDIRRQQGQFRPLINYVRYPSLLLHSHTPAHSPTQQLLFSLSSGVSWQQLPGWQVCKAPHLALSCKSAREGERGVVGVKRKDKCRCGYSTRFM